MVKVYDINGSAKGDVKLPKVFSTTYRPDLIQRAVLASQANRRQPYGVDPLAGKRTSAHFRGARRGFGCMQNREMARGPRVYGSSPGQDFRERFAPQARGGREAHPPKVEKIWAQKINDKERKLALASAIAATAHQNIVAGRAHKTTDMELPIVVEDDIQKVSKTKQLAKALLSLKLEKEMSRAADKRVRPGKGKMRGRKYKQKKSVLIVVGKDEGVCKAGNLPGVDVCTISGLNVELLAPGGHAGRLTIWSKAALEQLNKTYK